MTDRLHDNASGGGPSGGPTGHIKTYVLQKQRMTKAQRSAYERLAVQFCIPFSAEPWNPRGAFNDPASPLVLEIGFGMGRTTAQIAEAWPHTNLLGVEVHRPGVGRLLLEIERRELANVRIIQHDAVDVLTHMVVEPVFDGVHVFFPDPWPKKRHRKRRLIRPGISELIRDRLKQGGYLYVVTDWEDYAAQIITVLRDTPGLHNPYDGFAPRQAWRPDTSFERKGRARNHTIFEVYVTRGE